MVRQGISRTSYLVRKRCLFYISDPNTGRYQI